MSGPVIARLCGFDNYDGIPDDHKVAWLRGKATVELTVPKPADGGPAWIIGNTYVIVPASNESAAQDIVLRLAGQSSLCEEAS